MNNVVPAWLAHTNATRFLGRVEPRAITHLRTSLVLGTFDGRRYSHCFFGKLAQGSGYSFSNHVAPDRTLVQFLRNLGVRRTARSRTYEPIELFSAWIIPGHTPKNDERARLLFSWCDEALLKHKPAEVPDTFSFLEHKERQVLVSA